VRRSYAGPVKSGRAPLVRLITWTNPWSEDGSRVVLSGRVVLVMARNNEETLGEALGLTGLHRGRHLKQQSPMMKEAPLAMSRLKDEATVCDRRMRGERTLATPVAIPERTSSRYAGQYARALDPQRMLEILDDSLKIALGSKNPETARARFDLAIEAYHQVVSLGLPASTMGSVKDAMTQLVGQFSTRVCLNEARGLCERARKLKGVRGKLVNLNRAREVLESGLASGAGGAEEIASVHREVVEEIRQVGEASGKS
jgi:hypothetical protein